MLYATHRTFFFSSSFPLSLFLLHLITCRQSIDTIEGVDQKSKAKRMPEIMILIFRFFFFY